MYVVVKGDGGNGEGDGGDGDGGAGNGCGDDGGVNGCYLLSLLPWWSAGGMLMDVSIRGLLHTCHPTIGSPYLNLEWDPQSKCII